MQATKDIDGQIHDISQKLASETDKEERAELSERLSYLQHNIVEGLSGIARMCGKSQQRLQRQCDRPL